MPKTKVFISWSGQPSRAIAERLRDWIPCVIQDIQPWLSSEDIRKGSRWVFEIASALETAHAGILCLTPANIDAAWLLFEAGALSKAIPNSTNAVCTYLYKVDAADLGGGPLGQFQHTRAEKNDTLRLLKTLNEANAEGALPESLLGRLFEKWWPDLEDALRKLPSPTEPTRPKISERELLENIWELIQQQTRVPPVQYGLLGEPQEQEEPPKVVNLMEALRRSLDRVSRDKGPSPLPPLPTRRRRRKS